MLVQQDGDQQNLPIHQRDPEDTAIRTDLDLIDRTPLELADSFGNTAEILNRSDGHSV